MSDKISTKAGVFESGDKDVFGAQYKEGRLIACRNNKLEDYTVADGTEVICDRAFMNLKDLRRVVLPSSVRAIGDSAFAGCKSLESINIPEGVTVIRQATFRDCDNLKAIELPASVTEIEKYAFGRGLETLAVNAPEMDIHKYAFMNAKDFKTLIVPAGTADYYRLLLAEKRIVALVEEMKPEEPEEEPAKCVRIKLSGEGKIFDVQNAEDDDSEIIEIYGILGDYEVELDGKRITDEVGQTHMKYTRQRLGGADAPDKIIFINQADYDFDFEFDIPLNGEPFDPSKLQLIVAHDLNAFPDGYTVANVILYDGEEVYGEGDCPDEFDDPFLPPTLEWDDDSNWYCRPGSHASDEDDDDESWEEPDEDEGVWEDLEDGEGDDSGTYDDEELVDVQMVRLEGDINEADIRKELRLSETADPEMVFLAQDEDGDISVSWWSYLSDCQSFRYELGDFIDNSTTWLDIDEARENGLKIYVSSKIAKSPLADEEVAGMVFAAYVADEQGMRRYPDLGKHDRMFLRIKFDDKESSIWLGNGVGYIEEANMSNEEFDRHIADKIQGFGCWTDA